MYLGKLLFGDEAILVNVEEPEGNVGRVFTFPVLRRRLNLIQLELICRLADMLYVV